MRVLQVISSASPESGGPIEAVRQMGHVFSAHGVEVDVVTLDPPSAPYLWNFPLSIQSAGKTYGGKFGYCPQLIPWLKRNRHRYDCVVVNGIWQFHSYACWAALHETDTPYVVFPHGMLDPWFKRRYPLKHLKKWIYWSLAEYRVLRDARVVFFTCKEEMRLAAESFRRYRVNPSVVEFGTQIPELDLGGLRQTFFSRYPGLKGKRIAIFLGRIHPKKGCDLLIQAFHRTLANDPDWHLLMVGPDQVGWEAELKRMSSALGICDRVTWTGMLQNEEKWSALASSEIFVLPSHQENFGIVVAEALACSIPVLISNKVNIWREVEQDTAGICADDSVEGTVNLLRTWGRLTESERSAMKNNARQCFEQHFDLGRTGPRFVQTIKALITATF